MTCCMWSVFSHVKAHGRYDEYWKYLNFSSIRMVEKGLHLFCFFFLSKTRTNLVTIFFHPNTQNYKMSDHDWFSMILNVVVVGLGKKGCCHSWSLILEADEMNNRKLGLNIIWNLKIRIFVLWILSLIVNYGKKMKWNFNGELVDTSSSWSEESSTEFYDMWRSPAFAAAAVPTLYIKMSSFLFIPLFFGYFSPQKLEESNCDIIMLQRLKHSPILYEKAEDQSAPPKKKSREKD